MDSMTDKEFAAFMVEMMKGMCDYAFNHPAYVEAAEACEHSSISVVTTHDGDYDVEVLVHTPKSIANETSRPCIIYAHGGGVVSGDAAQFKNLLSYMATSSEVVVFNVDYRLAPGTQVPNNVLDFYEVVKHVSKNAEELGIDAGRICITGESGGGYITAGTMVKLAQEDEANLVKLAIPNVAMLSDYCFGNTSAMTKVESENAISAQKTWRLIAGPKLEEMKEDPLMFPGHADEDTLKKMPPTVVWSSEFDVFSTEAMRFASRLNAAGRLLEFVSIPGCTHGAGMDPNNNIWKIESEAWTLAINEYLVK